MGKLIANYHTHNHLCNHAVGTVSDYVSKAISLGMKEIGITDHNPTPEDFMDPESYMKTRCYRHMKLKEFYEIYLKEIEEAKALYSDKINIYSGLECEYIKSRHSFFDMLKKDLDYLNLGMHFYEKNGYFYNVYREIDHNNVMDYAQACVDGIRSHLFKIIVHPDLYMYSYRDINGERKFDEAARKAAIYIIEEAIKNDVYLEINVNGLRNSRNHNSPDWFYPYEDFWKIVATYKDAKVVIGIDAHDPEFLESDDIYEVKKFAKRLNIKTLDYVKVK